MKNACAFRRPGESGEDAGQSSPVSPTDPVTSAADAPAALPRPIENDGSEVPLTDRLVETWELPGDPDWLAAANGLIWVKRDDGTVSAIKPGEQRAVADLFTGYSAQPPCQGLTYDGTRLWTCAGENRLITMDPEARTVGKPIKVPRLGDQGTFVVAASALWVIDAQATGLTGVALEDGSISSRIELGTFCTDLARDASQSSDVVYAVCPTDGVVLAVDVGSGRVEGQLTLPGVRTAALGDDLWVGFDAGIAQVDPEELTVKALYDIQLGLWGAIYPTEEGIWVRAEDKQMLTRIDPQAQRIVEAVTSREYQALGDLLVTDDAIWTTASDDGVLLQLATR
jgi:hypothetical protein